MSGVSSRGSLRCGVDIIDLDRYMRSAVRPPLDYRDNLVVDAGGRDRAPRYSSASDSSDPPRPAPSPPPARHSKRYSHDSGLSESSYTRRRQKNHRRNPSASKQHDQPSLPLHSSPSVREFRVACEKALREQQEQIARVAQICEQLAQPTPAQNGDIASTTRPGSKVAQGPYRTLKTGKCMSRADDTSDTSISSSSLSSAVRYKDKHRGSCKTYKIIMTKLDELSRLFANRRLSPAPSPPPRRAASSRTVSVCDKLIATEAFKNEGRIASPTVQTVLTAQVARQPAPQLSVKHAPALNIAPTALSHCYEEDARPPRDLRSTGTREKMRSPSPEVYDLDNPVNFYEQSKRLQALHATTRVYGVERPQTNERYSSKCASECSRHREKPQLQRDVERPQTKSIDNEDVRERREQDKPGLERDEWLCARCRSAWRAICRTLPTLFSRAKLY